MLKAEDLENTLGIPADSRDLNYNKYFSEGTPEVNNSNEYHSNNTTILDVEGMKKITIKITHH